MAYIDIGFEPNLDPPDYFVPICPLCKQECTYFFADINRDILACDNCLTEKQIFESVTDAFDYMETI